MTAPVRLHNVRKTYPRGVVALDNVTVDFPAGSMTAVMGPSGSGKSTLLHCAAGLDEPDSGEVTLVGVPLTGKNETQLTEVRRAHAAFVFQQFNLMPALTVRQNVTLPGMLAGVPPKDERVTEVLRRVGLTDRAAHRPSELSGGQQQRVAIARALVSRAEVLFADEPTGALDSRTALEVLELLREVARDGQTIILVTHDPVVAAHADQVLFLVDGRIVTQLAQPTVEQIATQLIGTNR
jgi:putative ABC transport system ATP-binding protein